MLAFTPELKTKQKLRALRPVFLPLGGAFQQAEYFFPGSAAVLRTSITMMLIMCSPPEGRYQIPQEHTCDIPWSWSPGVFVCLLCGGGATKDPDLVGWDLLGAFAD